MVYSAVVGSEIHIGPGDQSTQRRRKSYHFRFPDEFGRSVDGYPIYDRRVGIRRFIFRWGHGRNCIAGYAFPLSRYG